MQRLASRILIAVAAFVLVVMVVLVAKSRNVRPEASGPAPSAAADLSIKEVELQEQSAGGGHWRLLADQAQVFDQEGRTALRKVTVYVKDKEKNWTIVGEEGDLFKESKNLEVRRNVVLTSDDGLRLETTVLRWQGSERRLWTDVPVKIIRESAIIYGTALDVMMDSEATTVKGRVNATFARGVGK
jgi:LPS export ABC transporter protein LptC